MSLGTFPLQTSEPHSFQLHERFMVVCSRNLGACIIEWKQMLPQNTTGMEQDNDSGIKSISFKMLKEPDVITLSADDNLTSKAGNMEGCDKNGRKWKNNAEKFHSYLVGKEVYEEMVEKQFEEATVYSSSFLGDLGTKLKKTKADLFRSQRLTYPGHDCNPRPVGGAGYAKVVSNPFFPEHDFFQAGRLFSVRLRHNNLTFTDDAMLDGRVTCIKFKDTETGGDLDIVLYTGRVPPYYNASSFQEYYNAMAEGEKGLKTWILEKPINYFGRIESIRRNPVSYLDQNYYSHVTYEMTARDGGRWLVRLRLVPVDNQQETGLPDKNDQENAWKVERWVSENRDKNYLRQEYKMRLKKTPLQYRLQLQLRNCDFTDPQVLNCCTEWQEKHFKWHDLAVITITHPLHQNILAKTHIDILANPIDSFKPVEPRSMKDFCSLATVIRELHGVTANSQLESKDELLEKEDTTEITVIVKTGKLVHAGTDADVCITVIGERSRTESMYLDTPYHDDFEAGATDTFNLTIANVGRIEAIQMELRSILTTRQWYLEHVTVETEENTKKLHFPCYQWVTSAQPSVLLRTAKAQCFYQEPSMYGLLQRRFEVQRRRQLYQWENEEGLPGRILCEKYDDLPREAKFRVEKERDLMAKYIRTLTNSGVSAVTSLFDSWDIFTDYDKLLNNVLKDKKVVRKVVDIWKDDKEFGRQILNGPHPTRIKRLTSIPEDIESLNSLLSGVLDRGRLLSIEIQSGHVYYLSYPELNVLEQCKNYKGKYDRYITSPECYLYCNKEGCLVPILIRIPSGEGGTLIYTPEDSEADWILAKMWVREADAQVHQVISRHLKTQLVIEAVALATLRNLPPVHPVFKLLLPHLRYTIGVNVLGRQSLYPSNDGLFTKLLAVGGQHLELLKHGYTMFDLSDLHLPTDLESRGVDEEDKLPNYHYRDDGSKIWHAINKYVRTVIYLHYWTSENLLADSEIQAWITDLHTNGFPVWPGDDKEVHHGIPESLFTLDMVVELVTIIIFTATCRNSALTLPMMDYYSYVPNIPTMLLKAPPTKKGQVTMNDIKKMLPSRGKSAEIIAACYTLSRLGRDEVFLGEFPEEYFDDDVVRSACIAFSEDLERIAAEIRHRNSTMDIPYTYLLPGAVPNSVSM